MKIIKTLLLTAALVLLYIQTSSGADFGPASPVLVQKPIKHWVDHENRVIHFLPNFKLTVGYHHLGADKDYWKQLTIDFKYSLALAKFELDDLKKNYLGTNEESYEYRRVRTEAEGKFRLEIPGSEPLVAEGNWHDQFHTPSPGIEGPWLRVPLFVSKNHSQTIFENLDKIRLTGNLSITIPKRKMVEKLKLPNSACSKLLVKNSDFFSVLQNYQTLSKTIDNQAAKYQSSREDLKKNLLLNCLEIDGLSGIQSFSDLLTSEVRRSHFSSILEGTSYRNVSVQSSSSLGYQSVIETDMKPGAGD